MAAVVSKRKHKRNKAAKGMTDDRPFDTPEIAELQEAYSVTFSYTWADNTPIYDTCAAIYRYQGGWAFEDNCLGWRPWSNAWEKLCAAPYLHGYRNYQDDFADLKAKLLAWSKK